ncbi:MAG: MFS transporter [Actinomycetota bacterium]|jgi:EmrB/QacA subfamily drug resistance transporter|nr:MFS transporter [Actinomycetota bacterium]
MTLSTAPGSVDLAGPTSSPGDEPGRLGGRGPGRRGHPAWTLVAVALGVMMVGLDGTVVSIANPYIARSLHGSLADLQWVTNAYLLVLAVLLIPMGYLGDRFGRKTVFLVGVAGFALMSLSVGLVGSMAGVIAFRALQGAFGAMLMPNSLAIIRNTFPPEKLNSAVGIWGGATAISVASGPIVGGLLVEHVSWESVFYVNVPVGALALVIGMLLLAESRVERPGRFDVPGLGLLGAGLFGIVFGLIKASTWGWGDARTLALLAGGVALVGLFGVVEARTAEPLLPMRLFRRRSITFGTVTVLLGFFAMFGVLFFVTLYLQNVHGYDPVEAGVHMLPLTAVFVVASPLGGVLNQRFGPKLVVPLGMAMVGVGLVLLLSLQPASGYVHLWPSFVLVGMGVGMVIVASSDAIVANAPRDDAGVAGGLQSTALQLGGVLGTSILGSVLVTRVGSALVGSLVGAGVPGALATRLHATTELVAQGAAPTFPGAPARLQQAVVAGSHHAFMTGLHIAILVAAVAAFVAAVLGLLLQRSEPSEGGRAVVL